MRLFERVLRTFLGCPLLFADMCLKALVIIASGESDRSERALASWSRLCLRIAGARIVHRAAPLDPARSYVFVSNHTSLVDVPAIIASLDRPLRFLAKKELSYVPFFGAAAKRMGHIFVDRKSSRAAAGAIERRLAKGLTRGLGLLFFAEGTRATTDELLPFKRGAAVTALELQLDVVPMAIAGAREVLPPKGFALFTPGAVALVVGAPIPVGSFSYATREAFAQAQRAAVQRALDEAHALLAEARGNR